LTKVGKEYDDKFVKSKFKRKVLTGGGSDKENDGNF